MKFRIYGMVLSLFFALGLVFSFGIEASADHRDGTGIAAEEVDPTSRMDVENFLDHILDFYNENYIPTDSSLEQGRKVAVYGRKIREEGVYKNSENGMYSMGISERGYVTNHSEHPSLYGYKFAEDASDSDVADVIKKLIDGSDTSMTDCQKYGEEDRWACAKKVDGPSGLVTVIAGLDHAENDSAFRFPDCTDLSMPDTSAKEVTDKDSLKKYVESVIALSKELLTDIGTTLFKEYPVIFSASIRPDATPEQQAEAGKLTVQRLLEKVACFSNSDPDNGPVLKHETIYIFIMGMNDDATVLFNGNSPALNGLDLQVNDPNPINGANPNIAELILNEVRDAQGNPKKEGAFVEYHWLKPGDEPIDNWFEDNVVPGDSRKISYVMAENLNTSELGPAANYIFGSGIYQEMGDDMPGDDMPGDDMPGDDMPGDDMPGDDMPGDDMPGDDMPTSVSGGGCAIAGADNMSQSALLNLLLAASVLFSVIFLRKRA